MKRRFLKFRFPFGWKFIFTYFDEFLFLKNRFTQNYITGCPKFCFKTEIGLKMNDTLFCRNE
ncbi:hypothetical protein LEP1GSC040_2797 [Leptospira santarosai str. 2000030832]|nr:hypothetical protein LEP1GSC040_2797 [Leptospira santarosai str. 2000030832]